MKRCLVLILVLGLATAASADYYIAGDFNGWNAAGNLLTDNLDGTFSADITGLDVGSRHEFKVTNGTWDWNVPGANSWLYADAEGNVTITFNPNTVSDGWLPEQNRIGLSADTGAWTIAGSFQGWDNANPATAMTSLGGGMYQFSQALSAGEYWFKAVVTGTWDSIGAYDRSTNTGDLYANLASDAVLNVFVDNAAGTIRYEVVPEPATMSLLALGSLLALKRRK